MAQVLFKVIDLETTGLAPPECVIEVGWRDVFFDTDEKVATVSAPQNFLCAPIRPITPENRAVHHITDAMLQDWPPCTDEALKTVATFGEPFAVVAASCAFEQQWLTEAVIGPARWICTVKAAARLFPDAESHSNQAMRYRMGLDLPDHLAMPPHRAGPDAYVTGHILANMLISTPVRDLVKWTLEPKFLPRCPMKKWKGAPWADVETSYLDWILRTPDMDPDVVHAARLELERR